MQERKSELTESIKPKLVRTVLKGVKTGALMYISVYTLLILHQMLVGKIYKILVGQKVEMSVVHITSEKSPIPVGMGLH